MADQLPTTNPAVSFLVELVQRIGQKSPKFFVVLSVIASIATAVTGLPALLDWWGVHLPASLTVLENTVVAKCSLTALFISMLTAKNAVGVATNNANNALPFTREQDLKLPPSPAKNA